MPAYHQMGHDSINLVLEDHLRSVFHGAILSPVNASEAVTSLQIGRCRELSPFEIIFDPQLYFPRSERGQLSEWAYFPRDVDTANLAAERWWQGLLVGVSETCRRLEVDACCSPSIVPNAFTDDYFQQQVAYGNRFAEMLHDNGIGTLQTAVVSIAELAIAARPLEIASILSQSDVDRIYLILASDVQPRREFADADAVKGALVLVRALESAGMRVLVGFSSTDMLLWKAAGAHSCATGKFFNLRRFTRARFEEPSQGGGQLPYWIEESLVAFLREADLRRVEAAGYVSDASRSNPYGAEVLNQLTHRPGTAWLGLGWRQFMYWFADVEARISDGRLVVRDLLRQADANWRDLEERDVLMDEVQNDGRWVRRWRQALADAFRS